MLALKHSIEPDRLVKEENHTREKEGGGGKEEEEDEGSSARPASWQVLMRIGR